MNRGILEHVWKSYVIVAVLFIYSNAAFAFDDIESVRQKMSKGDVITNTDSIDFLFKIDRGKQVQNPCQNINCIFYNTALYDDGYNTFGRREKFNSFASVCNYERTATAGMYYVSVNAFRI